MQGSKIRFVSCLNNQISTNMDAIDKAIKDLESGKFKFASEAARHHGVKEATLSRRRRGKTVSRKHARENQKNLSNHQEKELVKYINKLSGLGIPPTNAMVKRFATEVAGFSMGQNWVYRFVNAHESELKSAYLTGFDLSRKKADNAYQYRLYFELVCNPEFSGACADFM